MLVLNKTDGLLRLGQVNSEDVAGNLVALCDRDRNRADGMVPPPN